jgi:diguanylate cyclase (GGDEF)-like protein
MKILVLAADAKERAIIERSLQQNKHDVFPADTLEAALELMETQRPRLAIVDDDIGSDMRLAFIGRVRSVNRPHVHILSLVTSIDAPLDSDDAMRKPFTLAELMTRVSLAQRFLSLGDNLIEARTQIDEMALYDPLTGLMNHGAFFRTAQGELERARRSAAPLSVIWLDLDNFKDINGTYGMEAGDAALKVVATTIRERSRPYDCIGRWSGDQFLVALPGIIGEDAEKIANRIIKGVLSAEILYDGQALPIGISAGVATIVQIHSTTELPALIDQARQAGARAKETGGNRVFLTFA